jgi:hypothetical protein
VVINGIVWLSASLRAFIIFPLGVVRAARVPLSFLAHIPGRGNGPSPTESVLVAVIDLADHWRA